MSDEFVLNSSLFAVENNAEGESLLSALKGQELRLRSALWELMRDKRFGEQAFVVLCLIGDESDLARLSSDSRVADGEWLEFFVGSLFQPATRRQWELLRKAAVQEWKDGSPDRSAVRTLRMMEHSRADVILAEALRRNGRMEVSIRRAIEYRRAWRRPTRGMDLEKLVEEVRIGIRPEVQGDTVQISLSKDKTKALARLQQSAGLDDYLYEATLYRSGGEWVLRGLHFVLQMLRAPDLAR